MTEKLTFDTVIATRNRPEALALSIPLIIGQSRQPEKLIIIDSSDDHKAVKSVVEQAVRGWPCEVILRASERGLTLQRNIGLDHVTADVVFFPDDDSMLHPGTTEAIMQAYELDKDCKIAGVCAADSLKPPQEGFKQPSFQKSRAHQYQSKLDTIRTKLKKKGFSLDPYFLFGELLNKNVTKPEWLDRQNCVFVPYMTGYRMSFRTNVIRQVRFDENLRNYALGEDVDASLRAMKHGALLGARNGQIYHHKFPGSRADNYNMGIMQVMNRSYICEKAMRCHSFSQSEEHQARRNLYLFLALKLIQNALRISSKSSRDQLRGMLHSIKYARRFRSASNEDLAPLYAAGLYQLTKHS